MNCHEAMWTTAKSELIYNDPTLPVSNMTG